MGELIRNIREIQLGNETLMVEENEGYSAHQGRLIHIQNRDFRYLMSEKSFIQLLTTILRAREEKNYYKANFPRVREEERLRHFEKKNERTDAVVGSLAAAFQRSGLRFRLVDCGARFATFLIHSDDFQRWRNAMNGLKDFKKTKHVFGPSMGYEFLYQMRPFELYRTGDFYAEFYFQLPCMSLTPKTWIPLDRKIQRRVWEQHRTEAGIPVLDSVCACIYRLCWAVFYRGFFSEKDRAGLDACPDALEDPALPELLKAVFFQFAPRMLELLRARDYDAIIPEYYAFDQY